MRYTKKEYNRIRRTRRAILKAVELIERDVRFKSRPYTVTRMFQWLLWYVTGEVKNNKKKIYSKEDMWDCFEAVKIIERRIEK